MAAIMLTPEEALAEIRRLGFPPIFERIWAGEFEPWGFMYKSQRPHTFFEFGAEIEAMHPRFKGCVPIWESNGDQIVVYDNATGEFLYHAYEDPNYRVIAKSYQQFVSTFLMEMVWAGLVDLLPEAAEL